MITQQSESEREEMMGYDDVDGKDVLN